MLTPVAPEMRFVLAAVRRDAGAARARADAAAAVADWSRVAQLAAANDVAWWVARALPPDAVPEAVHEWLGDAARNVALASLAGTRELSALVRLLEAAGVRAVAYKGPALSVDVHGDAGARGFTDLDLLVAERDRDRALRALLAAGYRSPAGYTPAEERFYSAWEGVAQLARGAELPVELHWRCQAPRYGGPQDPADVVARAVPCDVAGGRVLVPAPVDLAVLLALHGVKHAWQSLLWVADFTASMLRPSFDWALLDQRAGEWRVRRAMAEALLVAHDLLALEVPDAWLRVALADAPVRRLATAACGRILGAAGVEDVGQPSTARYDLQWLDGSWAKLRYLALAAALPTPQERKMARFPDALLPLAYPVRAWRLLHHAFGRRA